MATSSSSSEEGDSYSSESVCNVAAHDETAMVARGQQTAALRTISSGLCGFSHTSSLQPRQLFCLQVTHNEVAAGEHVDLKLLLESLSGHEIAAKKDLRLWMDQERRKGAESEFLAQLPPPPPPPPDAAGRWQHASGLKAKSKGGGKRSQGGDGHEREEPTPEEQIMKLLCLHEGEQRVWAYPLHYIKVSTPFPEEKDRDIAERFMQFRQPANAGPLDTMLAAGTSSNLRPSNANCASFLLARAIGSDDVVDPSCHFAVRALTLSLAEVFRAYREITTSKHIYAQWLKGRQVVGPRARGMSIPSPGKGTASGSGAAARAAGARGRRGGGGGRGGSRRRSRSR